MPDKYIELNVGGRIYATTRNVLTSRPGLLARILDPPTLVVGDPVRDEENRLFIGRDADAFGTVLSFLITGTALVPPGVSRARGNAELAYFLDEAPAACTDGMVAAGSLVQVRHIARAVRAALPDVVERVTKELEASSTVIFHSPYPDDFINVRAERVQGRIMCTVMYFFSQIDSSTGISRTITTMFHRAAQHRADIGDVEAVLALVTDALFVQYVSPMVDSRSGSDRSPHLRFVFDMTRECTSTPPL